MTTSNKLTITEIPSVYIGHFETVTDSMDGAYGDQGYNVQTHDYLELVWEEK